MKTFTQMYKSKCKMKNWDSVTYEPHIANPGKKTDLGKSHKHMEK